MSTITIDGQACEFEGRPTILQVALDHGIEIPHYCYHPSMSVVASCRICLAEIAQPNPKNDNKVELVPKLLPTCQTPAADGMAVHVKSPRALANQKAVMEYLLIHHPLDCPVCDQAGECYLQDYSYKYGRGESRYEEAKIKQPKKDLGPNVLLYADRCIMCTRCVRFTREVTGTNEIGVFGRGNREQIDIFPGKALDNDLSANVIDICPVGALLDKDFLMSMRVWNLEKTPGIDGITASGDNISIEHHEGKIYRLKPRTNLEVNQWWTTDEVRYGWKFVHRPDRLRAPLRRVQGAYEECDWTQGCQLVLEGLRQAVQEHGPGSLAVMVSPMLPSEEAYLLGELILGLDEQATLAVGPVPYQGEDHTFPGGYTVRAEKAPNRRGVERALARLTDRGVDYDTFLSRLGKAGDSAAPASTGIPSAGIQAVLLTGNYPSEWATPELVTACEGRFTALLDTLPGRLSERADVVLPGATWAEKAGTFENASGRLQSFPQAIPVIERARTEGQIALDLQAEAGLADPRRYEAREVRLRIGDALVTDVHHPPREHRRISDMEYVAL